MKILAAILLLTVGCVDIPQVPDTFTCENVDCREVAKDMCADGFVYFCHETNQRIIWCLFYERDPLGGPGFAWDHEDCRYFFEHGEMPKAI